MAPSLSTVGAITLFVDDVERSKSWYLQAFERPPVFEDQDSVGFKLDNVICADLHGRGIALLNGPMNREWGQRTAGFADPDGHIWEVAQLS